MKEASINDLRQSHDWSKKKFGAASGVLIRNFKSLLSDLRDQYSKDNRGKKVSYLKLLVEYQFESQEQMVEIHEHTRGKSERPMFTADEWNHLIKAAAYELVYGHDNPVKKDKDGHVH